MTTHTVIPFTLAAALGLFQTVAGQVVRPDSVLQIVESRYQSGHYLEAEIEGRRLLEYPSIADSVRAMTEKWIAFALVAQGRPNLAQEHFEDLLRLIPEFELDPVLTSPKILSVFREAQTSVAPDAQRKALGADPQPDRSQSVSFRTLLFPGWEQLHTGRNVEGAVFLSAGIVTLGGGIVFDLLRREARNDYLAATKPAEVQNRYEKYNRVHKAEIAALIAFGVVYVASQVDVFAFPAEAELTADPRSSSSLSLTVRVPL